MKNNIKQFICDTCEKKTKNVEKFPYNDNWIYLYQLNGKTDDDMFFSAEDKHFCSKECFIDFVNKQVKK